MWRLQNDGQDPQEVTLRKYGGGFQDVFTVEPGRLIVAGAGAGTYIAEFATSGASKTKASGPQAFDACYHLGECPQVKACASQHVPLTASIGQPTLLDPTPGILTNRAGLRPSWRWESRPATSVADIDGVDRLRPSFTADVSGRYVAVADFLEEGSSTPVLSVTVETGTENLTPVARLEARGLPGETSLTLDGSASYDVDGDALTYIWSVEAAPDDSVLSAEAASGPLWNVLLDVDGEYVFGLAVQDGTGRISEVDCFEVTLDTTANADFWRSSFDRELPNDGSDQVSFDLGNVSEGEVEDILISEFDVDGGNENTFDRLTFSFRGQDYVLSSTHDFLDFVSFIEFDDDGLTDALISPNPDIRDFTIDFGADRGSVTLRNVLGNDLKRADLEVKSVDYYPNVSARQVAPVADARFDQLIVSAASGIVLDPHESTDLDGDRLMARFQVIYGPEGGLTNFEPSQEGFAAFSFDLDGEYLVGTTITDGTAERTDTVLLTSDVDANLHPVARIEPVDPAVGDEITLDGSQSYDFNGDLLSYEWSVIHAPSDSSISQERYNGPFARFVPDVAGSYVVQLIVRDGESSSLPVTQLITVPVSQPVADAGPDSVIDSNGEVGLDGARSLGDSLDFRWSAIDLTNFDTVAQISDSTIANPEIMFSDDRSASVFQLIVENENGVSRPSTVLVGSGNLRPSLTHFENIQGQSGVALDIDAADFSSDPNSDSLTHSWSLLYRPSGSNAQIDPSAGQPVISAEAISFTPDRSGLYLIQLAADDGVLLAEPVVLVIEVVNSAPVAVVAEPSQVFVGETLVLDGSGSFDPDGDALSYSWSVISRPEDSTVTFDAPASNITDFTPDRTGTYVLELQVSDFELNDQAQVMVTVPNRAPVVVLDGPDEIFVGEEVFYSAVGSSDPDGDPLTFVFEVTSAPTGSAFTLMSLDNGEAGFIADLVGTYTLNVSVSDGVTQTVETRTISALAKNTAPVLGEIRDLYTVELGLEFALDLTATDRDNDPLSFFATPLPLETGITLDAGTGEVRFRPEAGQLGTYTYTVGVSDGALTDEATLTIEVVPGTASDTSVYGQVLDAVDFANGTITPLAGMPVRLRDAALMTTTDAGGNFAFGSLVPGRDQVLVEPSAEGGPGGYLGAVRTISVTENQDRDLSPEFLLTPLNDGCVPVVAGVETVLSGASSGVTVRIAADTIRTASGDLYDGEVCLGQLPRLFDQPGLPVGTAACNIYGVDAPGATFTEGVAITAPNVDALPEGARLSLWQEGQNAGLFRPSGRGSVDAGAATVSATLSGEAGLFTFLPQAPISRPSADQPNGNRSLTPFEGNMSQTYVLPGYRAFNRDQQVALSYHSTAADPISIIAGDVTIAEDASLPVTLDTALNIGGLALSDLAQWTPREGADGSTPALVGEEVVLRQSTPVDAATLPSGRYPYTFTTRANYACSTVGASHQGELYVQNETGSPYGTGWSIDGLQKLVENPDGSVTIIDDDTVVDFERENDFTDFDGDPIVIPASHPISVAVEDFDGDGLDDVVVAEAGPGDITFIRNFGDRVFENVLTEDVGEPRANTDSDPELEPDITSLAAIDIDRDGLIDVPYSTQFDDRIGVLYGEGFFGFRDDLIGTRPENIDLLVVDVDQDGFDDVVYGELSGALFFRRPVIRAFYGGPDGFTDAQIMRFSRAGRSQQVQVLELEADDLDGDGNIDIVMRSATGIRIAYGEGNRRFTAVDENIGRDSIFILAEQLDISDVDNDGLKEIFAVQNDGFVYYPNVDGRSFGEPVVLSTPPGDLRGADFFLIDVDQNPGEDILFSLDDLFVYSSNGDGTFAPGELSDIDQRIDFNFVVEDMDNDGALDLVSMQGGENGSVTINFSQASSDGILVGAAGEFSTVEELPGGGWERRYKDGHVIEFDADGLQTASVDRQGNRIEYTYDAEQRLVTKVDQVGGVTSFTYGADGKLASITYPDGRETAFAYDAQGNLSNLDEPTGSQVSFEYDENGRLINTTNQNGNSTAYFYDAVGNMSGATLPDGSNINNQVASSLGLVDGLGGPASQPFFYVKPEDRFTTVTDRKGEVTEVEVNQFGSVVRVTDPLGRTTLTLRNEENLVTRVERPSDTAPGGVRVDTLEYDFRANVTRMTEAVGTLDERSTFYQYEPVFNQVTRMVDPDGFETLYGYDSFGEVTRTIDPEGGEELFSYTTEGQLATRTDKNGNQTAFVYDADLNLGQITYADGSVTTMTYDASGNASQIAEAAGTPIERQIQRTYDALNRVLTVETTGADGAQIDGITTYTYEPNGNLSTVTDETGLVTTMIYDGLERLVAVDDPAEGLIQRAYNPAGELVSHANGDGETHHYDYDAVSRLTETIDPEGYVKSFAYDVRDNIATVVDGRGGTTIFGYDTLDRMTTRTNPIGQTMTRAYDGRDNLGTLTREDGAVETAAYDGLSRRTQVVTPDNTLTYAYDLQGNLTEAADDDSRVTFTYDERNRLASTTTDGTVGPQPEVTLSYTYDALDRRTSMSDSLGGTTTYAWDEEDRLTDLTAPWGTVYSFGYDGFGRRTSLTSTSGRVSEYEYANGLLSALRHAQSGVSLTDLDYRYGPDGQLTAIIDNLDPSASKAISYDALNRLVQVAEGTDVAGPGGTPIPVEDYAYDGEGNRTASHLSAFYASNAHNQLLEDDTYTYTYDAKGNRISRMSKVTGDVETYIYDSQNRLIGHQTGGLSTQYFYDALNRRIGKSRSTEDLSFILDRGSFSEDIVSNTAYIFESQVLRDRVVFGPAEDEPIAFERYLNDSAAGSGEVYELFADRSRNITEIYDLQTGELIESYNYSAFGQRISDPNQFVPFGFSGRLHDEESGLVDFRARVYDPLTGVFLQRDPIGFDSGSLNLYSYTSNDPLNWLDPTGLARLSYKKHTVAGSITAASTAQSIGDATLRQITKILTALEDAGLLMPDGGMPGSNVPGTCNRPGNSRKSQKPQKAYLIFWDGKAMKVGISGGATRSDGLSVRALRSATRVQRAFADLAADMAGDLVVLIINEVAAGPDARGRMLDYEREVSEALRRMDEDNLPRKTHCRP